MTQRQKDPRDNQEQAQPRTNKPEPEKNLYEFTDNEREMWSDYSMDTPIARAWSRCMRSGSYLGKPLEPEFYNDGHTRQHFQYAVADLPDNTLNDAVTFSDGRGVLCKDSGL